MDKRDLVMRIDAMQDVYAVMSTGLLLLQQPDIRDRLRAAEYHQIGLPRGDGSQVTIHLESAFQAAQADPAAFNHLYLRTVAGMIVTTVADDLKGLGYSLADAEPDEFHVLRHLRNAAAHGNRFDIRNAKAKLVTFGGLTISPALDGQPDVFFKYVSPAYVMDLIEAIKGQL
jgi:hypothetical protein